MDVPVTERVSGSLPETTAEAVTAKLATDATLLVSGFGSMGYPKAVPLAIAESDRNFELTVVSGGGVGREIDGAMIEAGAVDRRYPAQSKPASREAANAGKLDYQDRHYGPFSDEVRSGGWIDAGTAVIEAVAVGADWLIPSTGLGQTPSLVAHAENLIVEVNDAHPLSLQHLHDVYTRDLPPHREPVPLSTPTGRIGSPFVEFDPAKLEGIIRTDRPDATYDAWESSATEEAIADHFIEFIADEMDRNPLFQDALTFEFGFGALGNALLSGLRELDVGDRDVAVYGEVLQDAVLDLIETEACIGASGTTLALSDAGLDRVLENIERYAEEIVLRPTDLSNNATLVDRFGVIAVNGALEVDLYGHVNSTHINGTHVVNAIGGSGDFNRHSPLAVVALSSTASGGDVSRIVPMVPHVDHTEHDIDIVITEHGVADLRGTVPLERAEMLIS
ncbi:MAG: acetyl-CoA hydrolase/transferase C-terminal domain-containing protein, partial [Salinirussus sp.]